VTNDEQYEMYIDIHSRAINRAQELRLDTFYGQLERVLVVHLKPSPALGLTTRATVFFAVVRNCVVEDTNSLGMPFYQVLGRLDVVDITCLQCLVGRVKDGARWAILDRSGGLARALAEWG
jgi:hypothetical protein